MSLLSQFFQSRHKSQASKEKDEKNQTIAQIFNTRFEAPKVKVQPKNKILRKQEQSQNEDDNVSESELMDIQGNIEEEQMQNEELQNQKLKAVKKETKKIQQTKENKKEKSNQKNKKEGKKKKQQKDNMIRAQNNKNATKLSDQIQQQPQQQKQEQQQQNLDSTIFVGNVPLTSTHKSIKKFFEPYGKVLKVWFRSIPVEQSKIPKKGLHILKKYQEGADSMNAYVKFQKEEDSIAACKANGQEIQGKNIKVTRCNQHDIDYETTIFIGNLPKKVKDQQLWDAFKNVGKVISVRVIRNNQTLEGVGIGFVRFATKQEMRKAISQKNGIQLGGRPMRIKKAVSKERIEKKVKKVQQKKKMKKEIAKQDKTGKGKKIRHENGRNGSLNSFKQKFIQKNSKPFPGKSSQNKKPFFNRNNQPQENNKREFNKQKDLQQNTQSNEIIRTKFSFQGAHKTLQ